MILRAWERFLRFGFYLLYNQLAWSYDLVSWLVSLGQWQDWMRAGIPHLTNPNQLPGNLLEVAHGPGHMLIAAHQAGFTVFGIDLSSFMCRQAKHRLKNTDIILPQTRGDGMALPYTDHSFDHILSTFPAPFIFHQNTLAQLHRVLRPNGRLVIVPQARFTGGGWLAKSIAWLYTITGQRPNSQLENADSPTAEGLCRHLARAGFQTEISTTSLPNSIVTIIIAQKQ